MTVFRPQRRLLYNEDGVPLPDFPADVTATITLAPEDAFGVEGAAQRSVFPVHTSARVTMNINEGRTSAEGDLIAPSVLCLPRKGLRLHSPVMSLSFDTLRTPWNEQWALPNLPRSYCHRH